MAIKYLKLLVPQQKTRETKEVEPVYEKGEGLGFRPFLLVVSL